MARKQAILMRLNKVKKDLNKQKKVFEEVEEDIK